MDQSGKNTLSPQELAELAAKVESVRQQTPLSDELHDLLNQVSRQFQTLLHEADDPASTSAAAHDDRPVSEAHYRELVENTNAIILRMDAEGYIQFFNQFAQDFFGYTQVEIQGRNVVGTIVPKTESTGRVLATIIEDAYQQPQKYYIYENENLLRSGERVWVAWRNKPLLDEAGQITGWLCFGNDITARKQAEAALRESEAQSRAILEALPDMMFRLSHEGIYLSFYAYDPDQLFVPPNDFLGKSVDEVLPAEVANMFQLNINLCFTSGQMQVFEYVLTFPAEGEKDFEARMVVNDKDSVLTIVRNITEQKQATENQLERARIRLLRQFMDDTSHDLKTPITTLMTSTYLLNRLTDILHRDQEQLVALVGEFPGIDMLLADCTQTIEKIRGRASILEQSALRLRRLVESMADMVRLDSDIHYTMRLEDLNTLTAIMVDSLSAQAETRQLTLQYEADKMQVPIFADAMEFSQAIKHLIENALEYTPAGGTVTVRVYQKESHAVLDVHDTGIGIEAKHLPHIFKRFYRVDKTRSADTGGVGLGLTIVKRVVEAHNGQIEVQSSPGEGSLFRISIPTRN